MRTRTYVVRAMLALTLVSGARLANAAPPRRPAAAAAPSDADRARALKQQGDEAMDSLRYSDALASYGQAYEITRDAALLYNRARAHQALGDFPAALDLLERFETEASPSLKARVPGLQEIIEEVRSRIATLTIRCNIPGAEVRLGDRVIGTTPIANAVKTTAGRATLQIVAEKYHAFTKELDLQGGSSLTVDAELLAKDASGILLIAANVAGAVVSLDGKVAGQVPVEIIVPAGAHAIKVERAGYEPSTTSVVLGVGERKSVTIPLASVTPITKKWWFWTGAGLIVAGGVVTVVVLLSEKPADKGTLDPSQVAAPLVRF